MKKLRLLFLCAGLCMVGVGGCGNDVTQPVVADDTPQAQESLQAADATGSAVVYLPQIPSDFLAKAGAALAEGQLSLSVTGRGMAAIELSWPISRIPAEPATIGGIPAGAERLFTGRLVDSRGVLTHEGTAAAEIRTGETVNVHLKLLQVGGDAAVCVEIEGLPAPDCAPGVAPEPRPAGGFAGCWVATFHPADGTPPYRAILRLRQSGSDVGGSIEMRAGTYAVTGFSELVGGEPAVYLNSDQPVGKVHYKARLAAPGDRLDFGASYLLARDNGGTTDQVLSKWDAVRIDCVSPEPSPPPPPAPVDACVRMAAKSRTCRSADEWRTLSAIVSRLMAGRPGAIEPMAACADSGSFAVSFEVCGASSDCRVLIMPVPCDPGFDYKKAALDYCAGIGATLSNVIPFLQCEGGFEVVVIQCCPMSPPPSPEPSAPGPDCRESMRNFSVLYHYANGTPEYGLFKDLAYKSCGTALPGPLPLESLTCDDLKRVLATGMLPPDSKACIMIRRAASVVCEPTPAPAVCDTILEGDPANCRTLSGWKEYAFAACGDRGGKLTDLVGRRPCGTDAAGEPLYSHVQYVCCR